MKNQNFKTTITIDQSAEEVFNAIANVRGWWSENILGNTNNINEEFFYQYKEVHQSKMRITEYLPFKRIGWLVLENKFSFTKDESEWKGNKIVFDISEKDGKTQLDFIQEGLTPVYECYEVCQDAWTSYIHGSLKNLITTGTGNPNTKENDLNRELVEKWGLPDK